MCVCACACVRVCVCVCVCVCVGPSDFVSGGERTFAIIVFCTSVHDSYDYCMPMDIHMAPPQKAHQP